MNIPTKFVYFLGVLLIALVLLIIFLGKENSPPDGNDNDVATTTEPVATSTPIAPVVNELFRELKESDQCNIPPELTLFASHHGLSVSEFSFTAYAPKEIFPEGGGGGQGIIELPFYEGRGANSWLHFEIDLIDRGKYSPTILDYISSQMNFLMNNGELPAVISQYVSTSTVKIAHLETPEAVYTAFPNSDQNCINNFLREIDDLYLVTPVDIDVHKPFPSNGIHNRADTGTIAPWGLYAAKYPEGKPYPIIMHFVYYKDGGLFFKDKPYTIEDIIWSVRFGVKSDIVR